MNNIFREDGRTLIFAFDHGAFMDPTKGMENPGQILAQVIEGGADAVMTTVGVIKTYAASFARKGLGWILTVLDRSPQTAEKSVSLASKLGVDAVKFFVTMGGETERNDLEILWALTTVAEEYGMPVLAEMYPIKNEKNPDPLSAENIKKVSRIGAEYGADFIKTFYTGSVESFRTVVSACPVPVVVLGCEKTASDLDLLHAVFYSVRAGGAGAAIGRNIFDHVNPKAMTKALSMVIHDAVAPEQALAQVK